MYLRMQKDGELEIMDYKKEADGTIKYRVKWGSVSDTQCHYTWETEAELYLAKDAVEKYHKDPVFVKV